MCHDVQIVPTMQWGAMGNGVQYLIQRTQHSALREQIDNFSNA